MDVLKIQLPFDHTSVLLEYKSEVCLPKTKVSLFDDSPLQVPKEFDFLRECSMMDLIGRALYVRSL